MRSSLAPDSLCADDILQCDVVLGSEDSSLLKLNRFPLREIYGDICKLPCLKYVIIRYNDIIMETHNVIMSATELNEHAPSYECNRTE